MKKIFVISGVLLALALTAQAAEFQFAHEKNDRNVNIPSSEIHKNLYAVGASVDISGNTTGDLYAGGGMVSINGNVEKDLNLGGGNVNVNGSVGDDARVAGGNVSLNGPVSGDLLIAGGNITVSEKASVGGDLFAAGGNLVVSSEVKGKANLTGGQITINGKINGDLTIRAQQELTFGSHSEVLGKIVYEGPVEAKVMDGAKVGVIEFTKTVSQRGAAHAARSFFAVATLIKLVALLIAGLVLLWLFPRKVDAVVRLARETTWKNFGIGFLFLVVSPIVAVILCVTVIGLYLGILLFLLYLITLILAGILTLYYVGGLIAKWAKKDASMSVKWDLVIGTVALLILALIPFIGRLVTFVVFIIVLGSLVGHFRQEHLSSQ